MCIPIIIDPRLIIVRATANNFKVQPLRRSSWLNLSVARAGPGAGPANNKKLRRWKRGIKHKANRQQGPQASIRLYTDLQLNHKTEALSRQYQ